TAAQTLRTEILPGQVSEPSTRQRERQDAYLVSRRVGSALVLVGPQPEGRAVPPSPGPPRIPHDEIEGLVRKYLGPTRRAGQSTAPVQALSLQDALASTRFGAPRVIFAPGIPDLMRDIESVVSGYFSMSYAAPHLFCDRAEEFADEVRELLRQRSLEGVFWDWPGDTEVMLARK